jgi:hypothetical protein
MAIAGSMKNFVNDLKASRRSRHEFVKGNRQIAKNIMKDNRRFFEEIHTQNQARAQETRSFLKSSKETRLAEYKQLMDSIHEDITRIHQTKEAITQGARGMLKEFREDNKLAHKYWASLVNDKPIEEADKKVEKETTEVVETTEATAV